MAQTLTRPDFIESAALARAALWKAALREGPGETPGPAGMALLADLRNLWLTRE